MQRLKLVSRLAHCRSPITLASRHYAIQVAPLSVPIQRNAPKVRDTKIRTKIDDVAGEAAARRLTETIDLRSPAELNQAEWLFNRSGRRLAKVAEHYHLHEHVFNYALGNKVFLMHLAVSYGGDAHVVMGNILTPSQALKEPTVRVELPEGTNYTLAMVSPDLAAPGTDRTRSLNFHWLVTDISTSSPSGTVKLPYIPPVPLSGTGYHRIVFALLAQNSTAEDVVNVDAQRVGSFKVSKPDGLAFFQCLYDSSVDATVKAHFNTEAPKFGL